MNTIIVHDLDNTCEYMICKGTNSLFFSETRRYKHPIAEKSIKKQPTSINRHQSYSSARHQKCMTSKNRSTKISWIEIWNLSFISPFTVAFKSGISKNFFAFTFHKNGIHRLESLLRKNHWMGQWLEMFRKPKSTNFTWYDQTFKIVIPKLFFFLLKIDCSLTRDAKWY